VAGELIAEAQYTFANNAGANTAVDVAVAADADMNVDTDLDEQYEITVRNPSAATQVTVRVKSLEKQDATFGGGADRYPQVATFAVPASTPEGLTQVVSGWDLSRGGRLTFSNDTALGAAAGFTGDFRVRRL
jgi:hypothetical protein